MHILITGASSGIGLATAKLFLDRGHRVTGLDVLPSTVDHPAYSHYQTDVTADNLPDLPPVEILINNAGIQSQTMADIDVNLKGTINVSNKYAFQPAIRSVVNVASASATTGSEFPEYAASKGGVLTYTRHLAIQLARYGATCNSISPGGVTTALNNHILSDDKLSEAVLRETLLGKWASPEEIAEWIYFVAVVNRSMTGQDVLIDNGEANNFHFIW